MIRSRLQVRLCSLISFFLFDNSRYLLGLFSRQLGRDTYSMATVSGPGVVSCRTITKSHIRKPAGCGFLRLTLDDIRHLQVPCSLRSSSSSFVPRWFLTSLALSNSSNTIQHKLPKYTMRMNIQKRRKRRRHQSSCCCFLLLFCLPFVSLVFSSGCCFVATADARVRMHHIMQKQRNKQQRGARGDVKRNLTESSSLPSNLSSNSTRWATVIDASSTSSRQQQADERAQWEAAFRAKELHTEQEIIQQQQDKEITQQPEASPSGRNTDSYISQSQNTADAEKQARIEAASFVSQLLLQQQQQLQSGFLFSDTSTSEIGGLEDVLLQIQRRIWTPLVTPPHILRELNIQPVRGLLLYGKPGCGKSLLARTLGKVLSPLRYV